jgi:hypothetical protein
VHNILENFLKNRMSLQLSHRSQRIQEAYEKVTPILFLIFVFACKKSDVVPPEIVVASPQLNQAFPSGHTITIKAATTDNVGLHMIHVIAVDNTGGHWVHSEEHVDGKNFQANKSFIANPGKIYTVAIDATDHNDNTASKEITVSGN